MSRTYVATAYAGDTGVPSSLVAVGDSSSDVSAGPFAARWISVPVNFGTQKSQRAYTTVAGVAWVKALPRPICSAVGRPSTVAFLNDEDPATSGVTAIVTNIVEGVSFDVVAHAREGINGIVTIQIMGV